MPALPASYRTLFRIALVLFCATALLSTGFNNHDEHFQILEFCNYRLGFSPASELAWEFAAQIRPALQPFIAWCGAKALLALNLYDPFWLAAGLRVGMAVAWWAVLRRLFLQLQHEVSAPVRRGVLIALFALWWVPYLSVRFSSEGFAALLFFAALSCMLDTGAARGKRRVALLLCAGMLLGFSLWARVQMCFAIAGIAVWALTRRWPAGRFLLLGAGGVLAIAVNVAIDRWLYGAWIFTPYNYYHHNIELGVAAQFGTEPWWWYVKAFFLYAAPPLSMALLILFAAGVRKQPLHAMTLVCLFFLIGHSATAHKEMRFLFPVSTAAILVAGFGAEWIYRRWGTRNFLRPTVIGLAAVNGLLLLYRSAAPAQDAVPYYRYLYRHSAAYNNTVVSLGKDPYLAVDEPIHFYRHPDTRVAVLPGAESLDSFFAATGIRRALVLDYAAAPSSPALAQYRLKKLYSLIPGWVLRFNINNWVERAKIWTVYEVQKK